MSTIDLVIPDIGNFDAVPVVDVLVKAGDTIEVETPLITLETDKATMDVPASAAGTLTEVLVKKGDKVVTTGGIIGTVIGIEDSKAVLRIAEDTKVEFTKASIVQVLAGDQK